MKRESSRRTSRCSRWTCTTSGASRPSGSLGGSNVMARTGTLRRHSVMRSPRLRGRARRSSNVSSHPASLANAGSAGSNRNVATSPTSAAARTGERYARARQRGCDDPLQIGRLDADPGARVLARGLQLLLLLQQPFEARLLLVIHLGTRAREPLGVGLILDRPGKRLRLAAVDAALRQPVGDPLLDHLAGRSELALDDLGLAHQRLEHDVGLALLVTEIAAEDLLGRLELAVDAAVALLEARWIPRQVEMDEVRAIGLQIDAFARRIGADQDAQRLVAGSALNAALTSSRRSWPVMPVKIAMRSSARSVSAMRFAQPFFQPAPRVFPFGEDDQAAIVPLVAGQQICLDPAHQPM